MQRLSRYGPEYAGGLSNHAPMAAEALSALGRREAILHWTAAYESRLEPAPALEKPFEDRDWRERLGNRRAFPGWLALFEARISEGPWRETVRLWAPRLAPGLAGAAFHGVLRAAHAVRALDQAETSARRRELAAGLAYWASCYLELPSGPARSAGARGVAEALGRVPLLPRDQRLPGLITKSLNALGSLPSFADVIHLVDPAPAPAVFLSNLTEAFAAVFIEQANADSDFALLHAVTGTSALRLIIGHLDSSAAETVLRYAWQAAAAIYSTNAGGRPATWPSASPDRAAVIERAVATGDEHAIKAVEACLREDAARASPRYLEMAQACCVWAEQ